MVARLHTVTSLHERLKTLDMNRCSKSLLWANQKCYEFSNKPHRMIVNRLKTCPFHSSPDFLLQSDGSPTYCPQTMSRVFGEYYKKLYNCLNADSRHLFSQDKFDSFFHPFKLPKLSPSQMTLLNAIVTLDELADVVRELPSHKSSGPDGLSYFYYKTFLTILSPYLLDLQYLPL